MKKKDNDNNWIELSKEEREHIEAIGYYLTPKQGKKEMEFSGFGDTVEGINESWRELQNGEEFKEHVSNLHKALSDAFVIMKAGSGEVHYALERLYEHKATVEETFEIIERYMK